MSCVSEPLLPAHPRSCCFQTWLIPVVVSLLYTLSINFLFEVYQVASSTALGAADDLRHVANLLLSLRTDPLDGSVAATSRKSVSSAFEKLSNFSLMPTSMIRAHMRARYLLPN